MVITEAPNVDLAELSSRIKFVREQARISKTEFARRLAISAAYATELESGRKTKISPLLAKMFQYEFAVDMKWLLEGKGSAFLTGNCIEGQNYTRCLKDKNKGQQTGNLSDFERLLSEISATYINISIEELENVMRDDFRRLTQALGFDACILYMSDEPLGTFSKMAPLVWFIDEKQKSNRPMLTWLKKNPILDSRKFSYSFKKWYQGKSVAWVGFDNCPREAKEEEILSKELRFKSCLSIPLSFAGSISGIITVATVPSHRTWPEDMTSRIRIFGEVFINALMRKQSEEKLKRALLEIKELKERFEADYLYLKEEIRGEDDFEGIVGKSEALKKILLKIKQVAPTNATVLILGETGTGKGIIASAIHDLSACGNRPLMQVNCAALAPSIIESELFGHEKGAFTGAVTRRLGRFEAAKGTTLFLDEIGDLPFELQPKLLRVLEEGEFERMGGNETIHTDIRLIAATSRDLEKEVAEGRFRSDLWYRLNIFPIFVPPLRERLDDIPLFVKYFVKKYAKSVRKSFESIPVETIKSLQNYSWPGNVRELSNIIERAIITSPDGNLRVETPKNYEKLPRKTHNLKQLVNNVEREAILKALEESDWVIRGKNGAARLLGFTPSTLRYQLNKLNIKKPEPSEIVAYPLSNTSLEG